MRREISLTGLIGVAAAQTQHVNDRIVSLSSCESLACDLPPNNICAANSEDGKPIGVGIAAGLVSTTPSSSPLSLSLITGLNDPGFTGIDSSQYEYSDA